jgi:hypothetical protein
MDPAKKRAIEELIKKFRGDEGERAALLPVLEEFDQQDVTVICGQKSTLELVEDAIGRELAQDQLAEIDRRIVTVEKTAEAFGITLDIAAVEAEVRSTITTFLRQTGPQPVAAMIARVTAVQQAAPPSGLNRHQRDQRKKTAAMLLAILNKTPLGQLDLSKELKVELMKKKLNQSKKEHDVIYIKGDCRTIGQFEVKAMDTKQTGEVKEAIKQLRGGRDELARVHGHVLDTQWTYLGAVCLPNLPPHLKSEVVRDLKICQSCSAYLLVKDMMVGDMKAPVETLLQTAFPPGSHFPDKTTWRRQYKAVTSRLLAMDHLIQPIPEVKRITGRNEEIVAAFTPGLFWQIVLFSSNEP